MIYYQVVCSKHNLESSLYIRRSDAIRRASAHRKEIAGTHNIQVLEVWIDNKDIQIRSTEKLK